ncbi:TetR/AcrR family transcriptional regulator [Streptomyces morookaense]|uniref:TetR family transcriptional regulator n=1 Tax=Streptomyces morookaense TaxID=1970 RepID=A0A7Y7E5D3_STRMO|nr:TetR family transcriptional regulator [Streptomyces morookaense]NVK76650.1 TetR family transcriptional regulator [Streptomyces morookaense]GHF08677.1 TetR family transcriptional regulator [Streptomyces morookaense]
MQASHSSDKQDAAVSRTFTESARRAQIVAAAIEVIAEVGYGKASFARIARHAGLSSTGMISYHFAGKDDLMREVVAEVLRVAEAYMRPRIEAHSDFPGRLRTHIESNLALLVEYPKHLPALVEVLSNIRGESAGMSEFVGATEEMNRVLAERLREGQRAGAFREFDAEVMVHAMRGAIDEVVGRAAREPDLDVTACGRELAEIFDRATRKTAM